MKKRPALATLERIVEIPTRSFAARRKYPREHRSARIASPGRVRYLFPGVMLLITYKMLVKTIALSAIVFFVSSLVWCGDADCLSGDGDEDCSALICSLLGKHTGEAGGSDSADCTCVCHLPVLVGDLFTGNVLEKSWLFGPAINPSPSSISSSVFHPPIAA